MKIKYLDDYIVANILRHKGKTYDIPDDIAIEHITIGIAIPIEDTEKENKKKKKKENE